MNRPQFLLAALLSIACLLAGGCPTDTSGGDATSNSNTNSDTGGTGSTDNQDGGGDTTENSNGTVDNANSDDSSNANTSDDGGGTANENSNAADNSNDNSATVGPSIVDAWTGTLQCERTQAIGGGTPTSPATSTKSLSITFAADGKPDEIDVLGYSGIADQTVALKNVGDTVTNSVTDGGYSGTMQMTVAAASYQSDRATLTINIVLSLSASSGATQTGTGVQVITARTTSGGLEYSADVEYQVRLQVSSITLDTTENKVCEGTLAPQ